ncbi:hypothetical protein [Kocuria carniphila]|uniref:hypothetical protein n=1 Tax=Kocuria carniphila TaxID=262208 RepID=UPI000DB268AF|nr:hypothetical protein [Kocuria carniphila]PZP13282.1 MAG: hypothetical protein DI611_15040 [Brachybacterium faecium]
MNPPNSTRDSHEPEPTVEDTVSELLVSQAREIQVLSKELATSYEKELRFFKNLKNRDKQLKEQEKSLTKKIWWLESERRRFMERENRLRDQVEQLTEQRDVAERKVRQLRASKLGKLQSGMWRVRKAVRSWR